MIGFRTGPACCIRFGGIDVDGTPKEHRITVTLVLAWPSAFVARACPASFLMTVSY